MSKVLVVGSSVVDLAFYAPRIPLVGETVLGRFAQGLGGKGFNQAVGAALAGARTGFISALGDDAFAPAFRARLEELGIEPGIEEVRGESTGAAAISVDESGRNSIIVALGASGRLDPGFVQGHARMFDDAAVVLLQFETNLAVVERTLKLARSRRADVITILNPAPALPAIPRAILEEVDFLTPNETELATISGMATDTLEEVKLACAAVPVRGAILATLGEKGSFYFGRDGVTAEIPAFAVKAVDTAGAGDAFNGAFAAGLVRFAGDWRRAADFASAAAAISVTRPGTSASMAKRDEIERLVAERGSPR